MRGYNPLTHHFASSWTSKYSAHFPGKYIYTHNYIYNNNYYYIYIYVLTDLVLGSRSVGFTSATFFSQSKLSQSSLNWDILNTVQGRQCHVVARHDPNLPDKNCSKLLDMTQAGPKKLPKLGQNRSKLLKIAQNASKCLKMHQNVSKCLKMGQQVSKGVMCLHMQVRKLSLLGIAVAGLYCCMGLRSVSIASRSSLLLRSDPSIVNFNWQGSLVIGLAAIPQNLHCLDRKKPFVPTVSFVSLLPLRDTTIRHELLGFFWFLWKFERYRI